MQLNLEIPEGAYAALLRNNPALRSMVEEGTLDLDKVPDPDERRAAKALITAVAHIMICNVRSPIEQQAVITAALRRVERKHPACCRGIVGVPLMS